MSVDCIFHIKTDIPRFRLNQILGGDLLSKPYSDIAEDLDEAPFHFFCSNDLHILHDESWHEYKVKSVQTGTVYTVEARQFIVNYSLYDCDDDVDDFHADTIIEIREAVK